MKPIIWLVLITLCCASALTGCKKKDGTPAGSQKEPAITGSPADAPVALEPKWVTGRRYIMRLESSQSYQLPNVFGGGRGGAGGAGTNNPPLESLFAQDYALVVTNAADGQQGIEMEILGLELQSARGEQELLNYDSGNKVARTGGPMDEMLDKLIGGKIYYLVGADNQVVKVEGIKELFDRAEPPADAANPNAPPAGGRGRGAGMQGGMLRTAFNEDVFKQMIEMAGAPPKAVRVGESWTVTRESSAPIIGKLAVTSTNTLRGWQEHDAKKCARVEFTGTIALSTNGAANPLAAFMKMEDGTFTGHYWFAPELGISVETALEQKIMMSVADFGAQFRRTNNVAGADAATNAAPRLTVPMRQTVSVKLVEIKPIGG